MRKRIVLVMLATAVLMTTGCSGLTRDTEGKESADIDTVLDMEELEDGGYYVLRGTEYEKLYVQDTNYEMDDEKPTSSSEKHTLWYGDDWAKVPTLYAGDKLIYKTSDTLDEEFCLERFEYVGYTIGISNLKETESGRFSFETDPDSMNVNMDSDAEELSELTTETAIIDSIGGAYLRAGNVSSGGCVLGLSKDKTYITDVYAGSILHEYKLKADHIALTSMELYKSVDYDFMQSEILTINFPDYFNSGYYLINNYGLVRYVNGSSYDEDTDFNVPNISPDESATPDEAVKEKKDDTSDEKASKETLSISEAGTYVVQVTYESSGSDAEPPSAVVYDDEKAYQLIADTASQSLSREIELKKGDYTLEISGLNGRECSYTFEKRESFKADGETEKDGE